MATILVVDDDATTRLVLNRILGDREGHEIRFAPDGEAAIERLAREEPDLIITDLVMPKLNGVLLVKHIREEHRRIPVIAISGKAPEHLERAKEAGALEALIKPLDPALLVAAVDRALAEGRNLDPWRWQR